MNIQKNPIEFDLIELRKYPLRQLTRNISRNVNGLDTETLDGYCRLIADSSGAFVHTRSFDDCIQFLTRHRLRKAHNFFFNLNFDINAIIKYLPQERLDELYKTARTSHGRYRLFFIPRKMFRVMIGHKSYKFYDIMQFVKSSLEKASRKYLGLEKYVEPIDRKRLGTDPDYWKANLNAIVRYCINDAKLTKRLGDVVNDTIIKNIGLYPNSFISKASICKDFVRRKVDVPNILEIPKGALKYAFYSYSGGRFEIIRKGNVGHCYLYDINSAYPFNIRNLLDVTKGKWRWVTDISDKADYGFYLVKIMTHFNKVAPVPIHLKNGVICYPVIETASYMTREEIIAYEPYMDVEVIDGYEFQADKHIYPFRDYIDHVYELKSQADESRYEYNLYKILMNSLYGCFYEKSVRKSPEGVHIYSGKLFNPIYATLITANTRIQLFLAGIPHENDIVGFATDSILFSHDPELPTSKRLGDWSLQSEGDAQVLRSGMYKIGDKLKNRGIKKADRLNTPHGKFKDIFEYIRRVPALTEYPIIMNRPLTFIEVLLHHLKHDIDDINQFVDMEYRININRDFKRIWDDDFKAGHELFERSIDSQPLILA